MAKKSLINEQDMPILKFIAIVNQIAVCKHLNHTTFHLTLSPINLCNLQNKPPSLWTAVCFALISNQDQA